MASVQRRICNKPSYNHSTIYYSLFMRRWNVKLLRLIRKWLRERILMMGSLSPLLSNIMLDQLDKYLEKRGCKFIRYADDFSIYTRSKTEAKSIGNEVHIFLRDNWNYKLIERKAELDAPPISEYWVTPLLQRIRREVKENIS